MIVTIKRSSLLFSFSFLHLCVTLKAWKYSAVFLRLRVMEKELQLPLQLIAIFLPYFLFVAISG